MLVYKLPLESLLAVLLGGIAGSYGNSMFNFLRNYHSFPYELHHFPFPPAMHKDFSFSISLPILVFCGFDNSHPTEYADVSSKIMFDFLIT